MEVSDEDLRKKGFRRTSERRAPKKGEWFLSLLREPKQAESDYRFDSTADLLEILIPTEKQSTHHRSRLWLVAEYEAGAMGEPSDEAGVSKQDRASQAWQIRH